MSGNRIDIKTLEALREGNHKAFETVFINYYNKTKALIYGYIKSESDAEELAEDIFVNLWINHKSINTLKSFDAWLHTIACNAATNISTWLTQTTFKAKKVIILQRKT